MLHQDLKILAEFTNVMTKYIGSNKTICIDTNIYQTWDDQGILNKQDDEFIIDGSQNLITINNFSDLMMHMESQFSTLNKIGKNTQCYACNKLDYCGYYITTDSYIISWST